MELVTHLKAYQQVQVAIESTGNLWIPIYNHLEDEHIHTILTNPQKTRLIAEAKIKTDRLDARTLADLLRANLLSASYVPPQEIREQRSIIRERARLTQLRTIIKNRIHTLLDKHSIKTPYTDISGKHSLEWLSKLELPPKRPNTPRRQPGTTQQPQPFNRQVNGSDSRNSHHEPRGQTLNGIHRHRLLRRHAPHQRDRTNRTVLVTEETCQLRRPRTRHTPIRQPHNTRPHHKRRQQPYPLDTRRSRPACITPRSKTQPILSTSNETSRTQQSHRRSRPQDASHHLPRPQPSQGISWLENGTLHKQD